MFRLQRDALKSVFLIMDRPAKDLAEMTIQIINENAFPSHDHSHYHFWPLL